MAPLFWLPIGFLVGAAAAAAALRSLDEPVATEGPSARGAGPETRAGLIRRLHNAIEPIAQNAAFANEIAGLAEFQKIIRVLAADDTPLTEALDYAFGNNWVLASAGLAALKVRADGATAAARVAQRFDNMAVWTMHYALDYLTSEPVAVPAGAPLVGHNGWWTENTLLAHFFADYFARLETRNVPPELGAEVKALPADRQEQIKQFLARVRHPMAAALASQLAGADPNAASTPASDPAFLAALGRFWGEENDLDQPVEPKGWAEGLGDAATAMTRKPIRSLLVSGEALVGKTSFLKLLGQRIGKDGWRIFEASGADLQAGQQYIGQLEGRIRQATEELAVSKKVIWYVPDLLSLALSGTHQGQSASILDQLMPAISSGRILIWAEASAASTGRLLQLRPALRRVLEVVRLEPLDVKETQPIAADLVRRLEQDGRHKVDRDFAETAIDAARHYLSASALPGSALALIKIAGLRAEKEKGGHLAAADILDTLAQLTGLPRSILDGSERIDLAEISSFFSSRVIGQPEAVSSVVERIAMLKSGLNDPMKPFGVFLFAGPTGTGKTELAKAIAEYLFGSVERMIRLDMSEYQTADAVGKIMGGPGLPAEADTLVSRIRKQPFSLILLDEFEKSNPHIWDLFLQVFDEGRLTDAFGHTADFRHCLIILTTNLGATTHQSSGLGFAPSQAVYTNDQVMRAIGQTFRPEFQNRLDKIIVFRPLTRENMRGILKKELGRLFERRGLKDRSWAVEWEASALEFLLERGFSPDMGARPLKRAIDQYVVAPLAAAIVERRTPEGEQFVFAKSDGTAIQAEFVDPDGDGDPATLAGLPPQPASTAAGGAPTLTAIMLNPRCTVAEIEILGEALEEIAATLGSADWLAMKASLSEAINASGFWSTPERFATLTRFELMDRVSVAADSAQSLRHRIPKPRGRPGKVARDLVARLALQAHLVKEGLRDVAENAPVEVALLVEAALDVNPAERQAVGPWRAQVLEMYRGWCRKRSLTVADVEPVRDGGLPVLLVSGFGAARALAREAGLHVLEQADGATAAGRIAVRVMVVPSPPGEMSRAQRRAALIEAFEKAPRPATVVRRYRRQPSPLVRNADGSWRSGKLDAVLAGDFDILAHEPAVELRPAQPA